MRVLEAVGQIITLIIYPFGILVSKICVIIIIITCLGLTDASWPQPGYDFAVSMGTVEETVLLGAEDHPCRLRGNRMSLDEPQS